MNPTIRFRNQMSRTLNKLLRQTSQEKITLQHRLNLHQLLLRQFEIKINIQSRNKLSNRIRILIRLLLNDTNEFANLFLICIRITFAEMGSHYGGSNVSKDPGGGGLDGVDVGGGEEEFAEGFATVFGVEEGEEGPVDQPRSMVQLYRWIREGLLSKNVMERDVLCR